MWLKAHPASDYHHRSMNNTPRHTPPNTHTHTHTHTHTKYNSLDRILKAGAVWNTFVIPGPGIYLAYLVCSGFSTRVFPGINKENYTK
jgi:hypothetical protein